MIGNAIFTALTRNLYLWRYGRHLPDHQSPTLLGRSVAGLDPIFFRINCFIRAWMLPHL